MGIGWEPRLLVVASELSITTMSPVVCRGDGPAGNQKTSVLVLRFLMVPGGNSFRLTSYSGEQYRLTLKNSLNK